MKRELVVFLLMGSFRAFSRSARQPSSSLDHVKTNLIRRPPQRLVATSARQEATSIDRGSELADFQPRDPVLRPL